MTYSITADIGDAGIGCIFHVHLHIKCRCQVSTTWSIQKKKRKAPLYHREQWWMHEQWLRRLFDARTIHGRRVWWRQHEVDIKYDCYMNLWFDVGSRWKQLQHKILHIFCAVSGHFCVLFHPSQHNWWGFVNVKRRWPFFATCIRIKAGEIHLPADEEYNSLNSVDSVARTN